MEISNAVRIIGPAPDSQYRLRQCSCGSDTVAYVQGEDGHWRVKCLDCGRETEGFAVRHDAQGMWNQ